MPNIQFVHVHKKDTPKGGYTAALECNEQHQVLALAYAFCSSKDNFNKKIGRDKAKGRLNSDRFRMSVTPPVDVRTFTQNLYKEAGLK